MTQSNKWMRLQEDLLRKNALLAEITVENTTPVIFGGYNAKPYSATLGIIEVPRPTEIKGQWRWWARALVSGALYNKGILIDISEANKIIAPILGGKIGKELKPAKVSVEIQAIYLKHKTFDPRIRRDKLVVAQIPRLRLLGQEILKVRGSNVSVKNPSVFKEKYTLYEHLKLSIRILKNNIAETAFNEYYEFALSSLLISLLFSGMGAITTRAFGSLRIDLSNTKFYGEIRRLQTVNSIIESIHRIYTAISKTGYIEGSNTLEKELRNIIQLGVTAASKYVSKAKDIINIDFKEYSGNQLPLMPTATVGAVNVFRLYVKACRSTNPYDLLSSIGSSVLKQWIKTRCFNMNPRSPGAGIHTFIMGLPRHSKITYGKIQIITGYIVPPLNYRPTITEKYSGEKVQRSLSLIDKKSTSNLRRISTIGFTVLNTNPAMVLVYGMLSQDIDNVKHKIIHRGVHGRPGHRGYIRMVVDTPLNKVNIISEFNRLWNCIISNLRC